MVGTEQWRMANLYGWRKPQSPIVRTIYLQKISWTVSTPTNMTRGQGRPEEGHDIEGDLRPIALSECRQREADGKWELRSALDLQSGFYE